MRKHFKIAANFGTHYETDGEMDTSFYSPAVLDTKADFEGYISVGDDDKFVGYSDEITPYLEDVRLGRKRVYSEEQRHRILVGLFAQNNIDGEKGICFYQLSLGPCASYLWTIPNLARNGEWATPAMHGEFETCGWAAVRLEEKPFDTLREALIQEEYEKLKSDHQHHKSTNEDLLNRLWKLKGRLKCIEAPSGCFNTLEEVLLD